ncbi:MAG: hypothetical protein RLY14_1295 [Planctomycetota bacterium]|jgi:uncharacterized protein YjcR
MGASNENKQTGKRAREIQEKIHAALERGVKDLFIAEKLSVKVEVVREARKSLGMSREDVTKKRYAYWMQMLSQGYSLEHIAELYGVKPTSVRYMLWDKERFSLVAAKKQSALLRRSEEVKKTGPADRFSW